MQHPVRLLFGKEGVPVPVARGRRPGPQLLGSPDVTMKGFDRSGHQFFHDRLVKQVDATLLDWLTKHGG